MFAGIELGGTKTVCVVGQGPDGIARETRIATGEPGATLAAAAAFVRDALDEGLPVEALGVGAFGPLDLRAGTAGYGRLLNTPKAGWSGADVLGPLRAALPLPIGLETDVSAAALGELRWGAAQGCRTFVYVTVGTGIGGGLIVDGRVPDGLGHPEMGHVAVARVAGDAAPGVCPFHDDCLEGLASGPAIAARWGARGETLRGDRLASAIDLEAQYLARGLLSIAYVVAPERIVLGGGVASMPGLVAAVADRLAALRRTYPGLADDLDREPLVVAAGLGSMAGPLGTLEVARLAAVRAGSAPEDLGLA